MKKVSKNYINQYKLLFYFSWIALYFIFPLWRFPNLSIPITKDIINVSNPLKVFGLLTYFFISAYFLNSHFKTLFVDKPLIIHSHNWSECSKKNLWLVLVCCIATVLHLHIISYYYGLSHGHALWVYNSINSYWHKLFDFPIQYPFWLFLFFLVLIVKQNKLMNIISSYLNSAYSVYKSNNVIKLLFMVFIVGLFILYTRLLPYYSWQDQVRLSAYPPILNILNLIVYFSVGTTTTGFLSPVIIQFAFYIISSVFLYKTINLYVEKETALLGASIYLFSPLVFSYASTIHLASGTVCFIVMVSYFFLKFLRDGENKDLILTAYFISIGSLYKRVIILMFLVCSAYLIINKIKQRDTQLISHLKVLSLSLISFLPYWFTSRIGGKFVLTNFTTPDSLLYFLLIQSQISWPIFILFLLSIVFVLFNKRDHLSLLFGVIFISYYFLFTALQGIGNHRYAMTLYPTIAVFMAQFLYSILQKIRWKHAFKWVSSILIIYLAILCIIPPSRTKLITFKYTDVENMRLPANKALEWILNETGDDERVLALNVADYRFYARQIGMAPEKIYFLGIDMLVPLSEEYAKYWKEKCKEQKISYIMFVSRDQLTNNFINNNIFSEKSLIKFATTDFKRIEGKIKKFLKEYKHDEFIKFSNDNDIVHIYIYKMSNNCIICL